MTVERGSDWLPGVALSRPAAKLRLILILLGTVAMVLGIVLFFTGVPGPHTFQWSRAIGWGIAGLIVSDALLAPASAVLGVLVLRRLPRRQQPVARGALLGLICLGIVLLVMIGARHHQQNPTAVPNAGWPAVIIGVSMILLAVVISEIVVISRGAGTPRTGRCWWRRRR